MRLKQCAFRKALQIVDCRPIYLSQQFEEIMKIKAFNEERVVSHERLVSNQCRQ